MKRPAGQGEACTVGCHWRFANARAGWPHPKPKFRRLSAGILLSGKGVTFLLDARGLTTGSVVGGLPAGEAEGFGLKRGDVG